METKQSKRLRQHLVESHLTIGLIGLALFFLCFSSLYYLQRRLHDLSSVQAPAVIHTIKVLSGVERSTAALHAWISYQDAAFRAERAQAWKEDILPAFAELQRLEPSLPDQAFHGSFRELSGILQELQRSQSEVEALITKPLQGKKTQTSRSLERQSLANGLLIQESLPRSRKISGLLQKAAYAQEQLLKQERRQLRHIYNGALVGLLSSLLFMIWIAANLAKKHARSIATPLEALAGAAGQLKSGITPEELPTTAFSELNDLTVAFNEMCRSVVRVDELERSNRELEDFAYIASHDLKEPLRGIHNYASFLLEDYKAILPEDGCKKLKTLVRLSQRLEMLIDHLLQYSRIGRCDLALDSTNLNSVLQETIDSLRFQVEESKADIRVPRPLPNMYCDHVRIGEVFHNLISNAIKYNDKSEKWVEIGWTDVSENPRNSEVEFYVRDNGIGIANRHQETIFRMFKRLHTKEKYGGGHGVGLTIAKKIIERHRGRIWTTSVQNQGTTIHFRLPRENS